MNPIEQLQHDVEQAFDAARTTLRRPRRADGMWWLDAESNGHTVTVQWSPHHGFGVSASALDEGYGEGPEETFTEAGATTTRVLELLRTRGNTTPPREVALRELRGLLGGLTQDQLATRLGVQQAAVSRMERRSDITLSSLRRYVAALGGELEVSVRTPTGDTIRLTGPGEPTAA